MHAEDLARRLVGDHLDEALRLAERDGLAVRGEREAAHRHLAAGFPGAGFGRADRGDLRMAVGARGDVAVVDGPRALAGDGLGCHDALGHGLVGEEWRAGHVADRVDPLHRRFHRRRDLDESALELNAQALEPEARDLRRAADGHQHLLDLELLPAEVDHGPGTAGLDRGHLDAGLDRDPATGERPRQLLRDLFVLDRHDARERLEQSDLDAVRGEHVGELDTDRAGADDGDRLGRLLVAHGAVGGDHGLLVDRDTRERLRLRAGRQDHRARLERLGAARPLHLDDVLRLERSPAREQGDLVLPEEELDPLGHPVRDPPAPLDRLGIARLEAAEANAVVRGVAHEADHLRVAQQRLGRNAAPVQAHAARPIVLDGRDREPELGAADRRDVAARPGADDRDVELVGGHRRYTSSRSGSSSRRLTSCRNRAPIAPSITR